jgi:outer membrane protein assembly factor BamB
MTVVDGKVVAVGGESNLLRVYESGMLAQAFDAETGAQIWHNPISTSDEGLGRAYEIATSVTVGHGLVAVGGKSGALDQTNFAVRTFDLKTGFPVWRDVVTGSPHRQDAANSVAFTDNSLVAVGLTSKPGGAQTYLVRGYDPLTGKLNWSDSVSSAEKKLQVAGENDDHSNQLESALVVVGRGDRAYVTGRIGETCDGVAPGNCDMLIRAYDSVSGKAVWSERYDRAGYDDVGQSMALSDDRLVVSGRSTSTNKYGYRAFWMVQAYKP